MPSRILLRPPRPEDERAFLRAARASKALHRPWTVAPSSPQLFRAYLARMGQPGNSAHLVCRRDDGQIAGVVNITNIVAGLFAAATWATTCSRTTPHRA